MKKIILSARPLTKTLPCSMADLVLGKVFTFMLVLHSVHHARSLQELSSVADENLTAGKFFTFYYQNSKYEVQQEASTPSFNCHAQ